MRQDLARYHRQMLLPGFGTEGQRKLLGSTAVILGCGALGTVSANMLARAGVGHLVIIDRDFIELTNLQRQLLFDEQDIADAIPKAEAAKRRLTAINSQVKITAIVDDINYRNIEGFVDKADVLIDGLDNFETRYLANDCAVKHGIPYVYGGAVGTVGMCYAILPHSLEGDAWWETGPAVNRATPCFRCLFEEAPEPGQSPTCDTVGVLGPAVSIIANFQTSEALKILTGNIDHLAPGMLNIDLWTNSIAQLNMNQAWQEGDCPCCKHRRFEFLDGKAGSSAITLCGHEAVQLTHRQTDNTLPLEQLADRLRQHGEVKVNAFMLRAELNEGGKPFELTLFADGRAIIKGTGEAAVARGLYAKYVGT